MVKIICRICGEVWEDERYDILMRKGLTNTAAKRTCCDNCVEKVFKERKLLSLIKEAKSSLLHKKA